MDGTSSPGPGEDPRLAGSEAPSEETVEASADYGAPAEEEVITVPVARYFALVTGIGLTVWGILGFIPPFTSGGALFDVVHTTTAANVLHIVTGLPGLIVWRLGHKRYATWYAAFIGFVYLIYFSAVNIVFGNLEGTVNLDTPLRKLQWIVYVALHAGLMLGGWLVAALAAMQRGDRATRRYRGGRRWFWQSRTQVPME